MIDETPKTLSETEQAAALNAAFDQTNISFHSRPTALAEFKKDRQIEYEDGVAYSVYDGVRAPLADCLSRYAFDQRHLVDARTLPREGVGSSRPGTLSKADLQTVESKVAFIAEHGQDAFERLPLKPVDSSELTHMSQWYGLDAEEKVRLLKIDPDAFIKLKAGPAPKPFFVNHAALAKNAAIRGDRRQR